MGKFDGITFNNHWSKWHGSKKVFGVAVCWVGIGMQESCWSVVVLGLEACFWFVKNENC